MNIFKRMSLVLAMVCLASPSLAATKAEAGKRAVQDGYLLAFVDADVRRVADAVLGAMLHVDYSVDPKVEGNITLRTSKPVSRSALVPLLETALRSVNAVLVSDGDSYRIVARDEARNHANIQMSSDAGATPAAGYSTEIIDLHNSSAREISRLVTQFLGKEIVAGTDVARNQIMIVGSGEERAAARGLIARFDVDSMANMTFQFQKLENVDPATLVAELQKIFQPPLDMIGSRVKVVPFPRLSSVLLIAANRSDVDKVMPWIQRLDAGTAGKAKLYSYAVQNGLARDLARSLQAMLDTRPASDFTGTAPVAASPPSTVMPASKDNSDQSPPVDASYQDFREDSRPSGPRIVPDEANNALLIYATGEQYETIRELLDKIDHPVPQVLIEATLAEVTLSNDLSYGVDWQKLDNKSTYTLSSNASGTPASIFPGFSYSYIGTTARAVLNTLQSKTDVKVLSAPRLLVLNNQTASLQVGDQVPLVTQQAQSVSAAGAPIVNTLELHDTGVILKVTPHVNESGAIVLDIAQEVSDAVPTTTSGISSPTIQQRKLASTVATRSGQMVALGGLIRDRVTKTKSGIPILSQIPLVGSAFGTHDRTGARTELIILLTPTVMRSPEETTAVANEVIEHLDAVRPLVERAQMRQVGAPRAN